MYPIHSVTFSLFLSLVQSDPSHNVLIGLAAFKVKLDNFFWLNFVITMYDLIKQSDSSLKMTPFAAKLVSNKLCFYQDIFFSTGTRASRKKLKISDALCTLCPDSPVYAAFLSDR